MCRHLFREMGAEDFGEFVVTAVPTLRESIRDIIFLSGESLAVLLDIAFHEEACMVLS
jgi:hypothetical protein